MLKIINKTRAPLLSLFAFILGNGLFSTLLTLRLHLEGQSAFIIGAMTSAYYAGLILAAFKVERFIIRVGHIRAFSAFASALAVICLLHGIFVVPWFWFILRFMGGFMTAGIFVVIESWLLVLGTIKTRGRILAIYMVTLYAGQASGQFLINLGDPNTLLLFSVAAMLSSIAVIPLAMTKIGMPKFEESSTLSFKKLYDTAASGVVGCLCSGLLLGAIYGLLPLFISQKTGDTSDVALFMALTIFGGMALQYPVGRLSDVIERRKVLIGISSLTVLFSIFVILAFHWFWLAAVVIFLFGGLTFTLYPISISHACDNLDTKDIVSGTQGLLLAYSIGATLGPFLASLFIHPLGVNGLFIYFIVVSGGLGAFLSWRRVQIAPRVQEEQFISLPQTSPISSELDPRGE